MCIYPIYIRQQLYASDLQLLSYYIHTSNTKYSPHLEYYTIMYNFISSKDFKCFHTMFSPLSLYGLKAEIL